MLRDPSISPLIGMLSAALLLGALGAPAASAEPVVPSATTICVPIAVGHFGNRVHVRCSTAVAGIVYFAQGTSDSGSAARTQALLSTALASGRDLRIYYEPTDLSGAAIGCNNADCRLIQAAELL